MKALKLQSNAVWVLVILAVLGMFLYFAQQYKPTAVVTPVTYKGEFDTLFAPENPGVLDTFSDTPIEDKQSYNLETSINLLNGNYYLMAFGVKVKGDMKEVRIDAKTIDTKVVFDKIYILPYEKNMVYSEDRAIAVASLEDNGKSATLKVAPLSDGKYVIVVRVMAKGDITTASSLAQLDFDATTEGDVDQFSVLILKAA